MQESVLIGDITEDFTSTKKVLEKKYLGYALLLIPFSMLLIIFDQLGGGFVSSIVENPEKTHILNYFFHFPHAMMTFISLFFDKGYLKYYFSDFPIGKITLIILAYSTIILHTFSYFIIFSVLLGFHFSKQQYGIERIILGEKAQVKKYSTIIMGFFFSVTYYVSVFSGPFEHNLIIKDFLLHNEFWGHFKYPLYLFFAGIALFELEKDLKIFKDGIERFYVIGNFIFLLYIPFVFELKYYWVAAGIPRMIHDLSSFYLYSIHDQNRNSHKQNNLLLKIVTFNRRLPFILWLLLPFLLASFQGKCYGIVTSFTANLTFMGFAMLHFCTESIIWKKNGPLLQNLLGK